MNMHLLSCRPRVLCAGQSVDATRTYTECKSSWRDCSSTDTPVKYTVLLEHNLIAWPEHLDLSHQAACKVLGFKFAGKTRAYSSGEV
jgi:hypothetical protein